MAQFQLGSFWKSWSSPGVLGAKLTFIRSPSGPEPRKSAQVVLNVAYGACCVWQTRQARPGYDSTIRTRQCGGDDERAGGGAHGVGVVLIVVVVVVVVVLLVGACP